MNLFDKFIEEIYLLTQINSDDCGLGNQVYNCLIDYTSAIVGGYRLGKDKTSNILHDDIDSGIFNVIGFNTTSSLETALLVNGLLSHVAELDDGVIEGIIHPGAVIFTSVFTVFQEKKIDWNLFVRAITIGYEVSCRIAEAIQPNHKLLGYHASATCGTLGVATALSIIGGLDKCQIKEALTIAMASSHGTLKVLEDKSELKPYNIASAAINGFVAYQMAKAGYKGADNPFEGEAGFFSQMTNNVRLDKLIDNNENLRIFNAYFKPYASCRYTHPSLEAALRLKEQYEVKEDEIAAVEVSTYSIAIRHHDHTEVPNVSSAKMCIPFATAVGLLKGSGGIDAFSEETLNDIPIRCLTRKVKVIENPEYTKSFPARSVATVTITTNDGKSSSKTIDLPKGEPDNPMTQQDLKTKLEQSCDYSGFDFGNVLEYLTKCRNTTIENYFGNLNKFIKKK